ncbi:hypothetical protein [Paenibacillus sp. GCM10012306]
MEGILELEERQRSSKSFPEESWLRKQTLLSNFNRIAVTIEEIGQQQRP